MRGCFPESKLPTWGLAALRSHGLSVSSLECEGPDHSLVGGEAVVAEPQTPDESSHPLVPFCRPHTRIDLARNECSGL